MRRESGIWCVVGVSLVGDRRGSVVEAMPYFVRKNLINTNGRRDVGASKKKICRRKIKLLPENVRSGIGRKNLVG